ncbi:hypothetical protein EDC01DRAFT_723096 [Geopyxis carbonaria]|nr:hypothetical protein EDC01DRAFT_723096 [Geopyxis carbonaria]
MQRRQPATRNKKWWWQKPRWKGLQHRLVTLTIAGIILTILVAIYLGLALSKRILRQEWHVLLILVVLVSTVFFCHSLVRLFIDIINNAHAEDGPENFGRIPSIAGPGGFANPREPIRINTQNPEALKGLKEPPPVYGLWRCSVRVNPDQFFWERRENNNSQEMTTREQGISEESLSPTQELRPPSYISDDGVSYAVYAVPEVRTEQWPILPPHPSELNRLPLHITSPARITGS